MKLLKIFLLSQIIIIAPLLLSFAEADNTKKCYSMFRPLQNVALKIKSAGGTWELFEKREVFRKHSIVGLHADSKITYLMVNIDYLCQSQEGIPVNEVAGQLVPTMEERGPEGFIEYYLTLAHELNEIKGWVKYAEYFKAHQNRKLDISQTKKTIENARQYFERYKALATKLKTTNDVEGAIKMAMPLLRISCSSTMKTLF